MVLGVQAWVCVSCASATLEARAVEQLAGAAPQSAQPAPLSASVPSGIPSKSRGGNTRPSNVASVPTGPPPMVRRVGPSQSGLVAMSDDNFDEQLLALRARRERRSTILLALLTVVVVVVLAIPLSFVVYQTVRSYTAPTAVVPAARPVSDALPPTPAPAPAPTPTPDPEDPEDPEDDPAPRAASAEIPSSSAASLTDEAWNQVDRSPSEAAELFRKVLEQTPSHPDAQYGLGYSLLKLNQRSPAAVHLCRALATGDIEIKRDVQSLLELNQLRCTP